MPVTSMQRLVSMALRGSSRVNFRGTLAAKPHHADWPCRYDVSSEE